MMMRQKFGCQNNIEGGDESDRNTQDGDVHYEGIALLLLLTMMR